MARSFRAALPVVLGYVALGIPCGILGARAGMDIWMVVILSVFLYSGSGQYMIAGMYLSGVPLLSLALSASLVNSRQLLYSSALSPFFSRVGKGRIFWFSATVTDESFGINLDRFLKGGWKPQRAQLVNTFSHCSWIASNVVGVLLGSWLVFDTAIASFAMTSIFLCLFLMHRFTKSHLLAAAVSVAVVVVCKLCGLSGLAILLGSLVGVVVGALSFSRLGEGRDDAVE